jgi:hypothetical protein
MPKEGHALYFPNRKDHAVIIGDTVRLPLWRPDPFKHVQLGFFEVTTRFAAGTPTPPLKTSENLPCEANATFMVEVLPAPKSLELSTRQCPATTDISKIVSHDFFRLSLKMQLEMLIIEEFAKQSFTTLLSTPKWITTLEQSLKTTATTKLNGLGFNLAGFRLDPILLTPNDQALAQDPVLNAAWISLQSQIQSNVSEAKKREQVSELIIIRTANEHELNKIKENAHLKLKKEEDELLLERSKQQKLNEHNKSLADLRRTEAEAKEAHEKLMAEIQKRLSDIQDAVLRKKLELEQERQKTEAEYEKQRQKWASELEEQKETDRAQLEKHKLKSVFERDDLRRKEAENQYQHEGKRLEAENRIAELRYTNHEIQKKQAEMESDRIRKLGNAEAEVIKAKALAAHAHTQAATEALLEALPEILEKAYAPAQKLGEVKVVYIGGEVGDGAQSASSGPIGNILTMMSTLPMLKEVMQFLIVPPVVKTAGALF